MQAPPLAFEFSERALDYYPGLGPVRIKTLLVFILRVAKTHHQPGPQRVCSIAVDVVAQPPEPPHSVAIERAVPSIRERER
jgi:hypothetical protein